MPIFTGINPQGFDLSMDFILTSPKTVDLYDLSGDGSKFFVTVIGKYNDAVNLAPNTDCSCNFFPHTYSPYKIEALKREMDSLTGSSFSYITSSGTSPPDVSFVMSSKTGSVDNSSKFRISQGDRNVSFLPSAAGSDMSYQLSSFIFYNLMDRGGRFYQKMEFETVVRQTRVRMGLKSNDWHTNSYTATLGSRTDELFGSFSLVPPKLDPSNNVGIWVTSGVAYESQGYGQNMVFIEIYKDDAEFKIVNNSVISNAHLYIYKITNPDNSFTTERDDVTAAVNATLINTMSNVDDTHTFSTNGSYFVRTKGVVTCKFYYTNWPRSNWNTTLTASDT